MRNCPRCGKPLAAASRACSACGAQVPVLTPAAGVMKVERPEPVDLGEILDGKWRLEGIIGRGGMATVYLAQDLELERKVAVKVLATSLSRDTVFVTRFMREAKLTAQLEHPSVVPIFGVGRHRGRPFLVMKHLKGLSLHRYLRAKARAGEVLPRAEVVQLFKQLCAGIDYIHQAGFIHRDLKASNIFLAKDGHATILDFGILRSANATAGLGLTVPGTVLGTPQYMSPEQALGEAADHRSDLYALGVLLYECIAGAQPFTAGTDLELIGKQAHAPVPDILKLVPTLPQAVGHVIEKALAKRPDDRFQRAIDILRSLQKAWPHPQGLPDEGPPVALSVAGAELDLSVAERLTPARPASQSQPPPRKKDDEPTRRVPNPLAPLAKQDPEAGAPQEVLPWGLGDDLVTAPGPGARPGEVGEPVLPRGAANVEEAITSAAGVMPHPDDTFDPSAMNVTAPGGPVERPVDDALAKLIEGSVWPAESPGDSAGAADPEKPQSDSPPPRGPGSGPKDPAPESPAAASPAPEDPDPDEPAGAADPVAAVARGSAIPPPTPGSQTLLVVIAILAFAGCLVLGAWLLHRALKEREAATPALATREPSPELPVAPVAPEAPDASAPEAPDASAPDAAAERPAERRPGRARSGRLQIISVQKGEPLWATVKIDGRVSGETPLALDLPAGRHMVRLERAGLKTWEREVTIRAGQAGTLKAELEQ